LISSNSYISEKLKRIDDHYQTAIFLQLEPGHGRLGYKITNFWYWI